MPESRFNQSFFIFIIHFLILSFGVNGQDQWRSYYSYKKCFELAETNRFVVGATHLGLIYYHKETASISVRNKVNGLSDTGISTIAYLAPMNAILVGYQNGNMDLIQGDRVTNIPDLKIENMTGSKRINHFSFFDGRVFCSTDFGILEIDVEKEEIASTFIIGDEASSLKVYKTMVFDGYLYAATPNGILRANIEAGGLTFYENWELFSQTSGTYCDISRFAGGLVGVRGEAGSTCSLELYRDGAVSSGGSFPNYRNLTTTGNQLLVISRNQINWLNSELEAIRETTELNTGEEEPYLPDFQDALTASNGDLWLADFEGGMMVEGSGEIYHRMLPSGPYSNTVYTTAMAGDDLWIVHGRFGSLYNQTNLPAAVSVKRDGFWQYLTSNNTEGLSGQRDFINIAVNPLNPQQIFVSSWGMGAYEFRKNEKGDYYFRNHFENDNSALQNVPGTPEDRYTRIWGLDFDEDGNLFMTNSEVERTMVVYNTNDSLWYAYDYGGPAFYNKTGELLVGDYGYKWVALVTGRYKGLFVFDDRGTLANQGDDRYRGMKTQAEDEDPRNAGQLKLWDENGEEITNNILSFALDKNGYIWFGTDKGVLVQYNPGMIFDVPKPAFTRIKVAREDGSGLADFLLEEQNVTCIAVDQANRKYLGTESAGVFLVSEDGTRTIRHFDRSNSPLPSNNIYNITIDDESGEVLFSTDKGLIAYMGRAVEGQEKLGFVYAYPNPVKSGYNGPVTITGLVERTRVKITDTAGNLVYETVSLGGNAFWNRKNLWGKKVSPGIYIVFLSSPDGSQEAYTKIAIVE